MEALTIGNTSIGIMQNPSEAFLKLDRAVANLNFEKLKWKLTKSSESTWSDEQCSLAELEYRKFLSLKKWYPKQPLVPSKLIDKFWHEHILDTKSYMKDCEAVFGFYIHHYPYFGIFGEDDHHKLQKTFNETVKLYEKHFGQFPTEMLYDDQIGARCGDDHACHAPSSCACRVPSACK
ncbi:hypothetical protein NI389_05690 [Pseudoalteromonas xiamenensis]|uniref:glycine-rich domain-containing protein n=1 Tax=Pseudoalteromonas xiamenensis TaxID=882626 RepID=UPI0027E50380|nr:hypothetical protein [Pseudoalteromonas xiamenensis]WMN60900.1 hypothetical protein NI389_05690 [Pseudoalteromonas xiamenensis]